MKLIRQSISLCLLAAALLIAANAQQTANGTSEPGIIVTRFGAFDPTPGAGDTIIPRNYGRGTSFFVVNLRSPFFGEPVSLASGFGFGGGGQSGGDRRVRFEVQFSF
ncbi:MAG TPA: hypothetical protein VGC76_05685 [Pyrinomonadaceae bacterium]|jgi:hypothetical protein